MIKNKNKNNKKNSTKFIKKKKRTTARFEPQQANSRKIYHFLLTTQHKFERFHS
jgi:hypothetical protein